MKKTKILKRTACALLAACSAFFTACGSNQKSYSLLGNSSWLTTAIDETCVYGIEYKKPESDEAIKLSATINPESSLTTKLYYSAYEGTPCYVYETKIIVTGSYLYDNGEGEKALDFSDETTSVCYFLKEKLSPLHSEKTIKNTAPTVSGGKYCFLKTNYSITCSYDKAAGKMSCEVTDLTGDDLTSDEVITYYKVPNSSRTYENYDNNYVDNELITLFPRACALEDGFYHSFKSLDVTYETINTLNLSVDSSAPTFEYVAPADYKENGDSFGGQKFNAYKATVSISSSFSGSSLNYGYATSAEKNYRLLTIETELAYSLGSLYYNLKSVITK